MNQSSRGSGQSSYNWKLISIVPHSARDAQERSALFQLSLFDALGLSCLFVATWFQVRAAEMRRAKDAADKSNKAKSAFLANMSHELRTPLNAIIGYSEMLEEEAQERTLEDAIPDLRKIRGAGKHLLALISDVLDLSKVEAGKLVLHSEPLTSSSIIQQVMPTVDPLARKNRNKLVVRAPKDYVFLGDRTRFCQVLLNLLSNACKFTEDGTVTVEVCAEPTNGRRWICWNVTDTGIGIPKESYNRLFRPFSQVDSSMARRHEGTGLGLTISQHFCELMGGRIEFSSEVGKGSRFTIFVPAAQDARHEEPASEPSPVGAAVES